MSITNIRKRDGRTVEFDQTKIENAILRAFQASSSAKGRETAQALAQQVVQELENNESVSSTPTVEQVASIVMNRQSAISLRNLLIQTLGVES